DFLLFVSNRALQRVLGAFERRAVRRRRFGAVAAVGNAGRAACVRADAARPVRRGQETPQARVPLLALRRRLRRRLARLRLRAGLLGTPRLALRAARAGAAAAAALGWLGRRRRRRSVFSLERLERGPRLLDAIARDRDLLVEVRRHGLG